MSYLEVGQLRRVKTAIYLKECVGSYDVSPLVTDDVVVVVRMSSHWTQLYAVLTSRGLREAHEFDLKHLTEEM